MAKKKIEVWYCERCFRAFDRPKPNPGQVGWKICDDCKATRKRRNTEDARIKRQMRKEAQST